MAYKVIKSKGSVHGLTQRTFIVDTAAEITDLPTNTKLGKKQSGDTVSDEMCAVGSIASVTETGDIYELNASGTWTKKPAEGSESGSEVTVDSTLTQSGQAADAKVVGDALKNKVDSSVLANYVETSTAESTYAKKSEISGYMTESTADSKYAAKTELSSYATKTELGNYATTDALSGYVQSSVAESTYAKKTDLDGYATTTSLNDYVKTVDLPKGINVADATGTDDVVTQLNALIASLKSAGIIANS